MGQFGGYMPPKAKAGSITGSPCVLLPSLSPYHHPKAIRNLYSELVRIRVRARARARARGSSRGSPTPWFASLWSGNRPRHVGISVWGLAPVCSEVLGKIAASLCTDMQQPKTIAWVYGYGLSFGLNACEENLYALREVRRAWPSVDVNLIGYQCLTHWRLQHPTFSLKLEECHRGVNKRSSEKMTCSCGRNYGSNA